jgi:hypothetical protein
VDDAPAREKTAPKKRIRRQVVRGLNSACCAVDEIAYRPAIVKLTMFLPAWWTCQLARLGMWLDDHWETGYWDSDSAPCAPDAICACCRRRAGWIVVGGYANDPDWDFDQPPADDYVAWHEIYRCPYCHPDLDDVRSEEELEERFAVARRESISWRWRWKP